MDHLADALNTLKTHELVGQKECTVKCSKLIAEVLKVLKDHKYLSEFRVDEDGKGNTFNILLDGRINDCGVIKPRLPVKRTDWARAEQRYIPGVGVGLLIVS